MTINYRLISEIPIYTQKMRN